jgi:DNA-directed RNA polymerase subunit K/omega
MAKSVSPEPVSTKPVSEFLFVEVAAQRCMQLMRGARPKIESDARKYSTLAISEVEQGLVPWRIRGEDEDDLVTAGVASADEGADEEE